jgi:uncharacterized protein YeaO (DUF488 family)
VRSSYEHEPRLAPTQEMLHVYKKQKGDWASYEAAFLDLLERRAVESVLFPAQFHRRTALLCSEASADHCHRRLVCEYLAARWPSVSVVHL